VKQLVMDNRLVVGIGNIYASESLFRAGIHPETAGGVLAMDAWQQLVLAVKSVLTEAVARGTQEEYGTAGGRPGYFRLDPMVYGRAGEPCLRCDAPIRALRQGGRTTFFCPVCQR
jgi:formamidopyrimidine-DNA glycosylase